MATGLPGGIGIPHARSAAITEPSLVFGRAADGIDWGAKDGPANLVFLIAAPEGGGEAHMQMLPKLARALMKKDFKAALLAAQTPGEVVNYRRYGRRRNLPKLNTKGVSRWPPSPFRLIGFFLNFPAR